MNSVKTHFFSLFIVFLVSGASAFGQQKNVLFIGNSYTGVNNLPVMTQSLALSLGDTLTVDSNTPGGYTFNAHSTNATTLSKIGQGTWDYVILQAQSQEPSFPPSQVASQTYPYAGVLVDSIISANPCTVPLFYMTWGRQNGDAGNCASYPVICTYEGMQSRLRESYLEMGTDNDAEVSPVGAAWKYVRDNYPALNLYSADESHPSVAGSYLAACVHYASVYKKSPEGATYISSLSSTDAQILQNAAKLVVIDSMDVWNFGVRDVSSDFSSISNGLNATFQNESTNGIDYSWDFGDGTTSTDENPTHAYTSDGTYSVSLITSNDCQADTSTYLITIIGMGIQDNAGFNFDVLQSDTHLLLTLENPEQGILTLFDMQGKRINHTPVNGTSATMPVPTLSGTYLLMYSNGETQTLIHKFVIY